MWNEPPGTRTSSPVHDASALTGRRTALSKNLLISPEFDIDCWNEFSHIIVACMLPLHALCSKRGGFLRHPQIIVYQWVHVLAPHVRSSAAWRYMPRPLQRG